jgi:tripeptidyl-peptidase I
LSKIGDTFKGLYNPAGRGFPDVAAQGYRYTVIDKNLTGHYQGTSCSAPMFAGVVALLNDARIKARKPSMGFLNPWLYSIGEVGLNDVIDGGSKGCDGHARFGGPLNGSPVIPGAGWNATEGWDPVTGYGTPDFGKLLKLSLRYQFKKEVKTY